MRRLSITPGYSLLLGIVLMSAILTMVLTVTTVLIHEVQQANRANYAAAALAAADSGTERALFLDFQKAALPSSFDTSGFTDATPYGNSTAATVFYSVSTTTIAGCQTAVVSRGYAKDGSAQRSVQLCY